MAKKKKINNANKGAFDVLQGSFDGAEVSELMGLYLLCKINNIVHMSDHGLYTDDGLMVVANKRKVNAKIRKELQKLFKNLSLII